MAAGPELHVTSGGKEYLPRAAELLSKSFKHDPVIKYLLGTMSEEARLAYLPAYFQALLGAASLNDARLEEADDWACCAVWMLPGRRVDNPMTLLPAGLLGMLWNIGFGGCKRMLWEFSQLSDAWKHKGLRNQDGHVIKRYHYLFFIATEVEHRGKGIASGLVAQYQDRASEDGLPIWLEATTPKSRDTYARQGFETVGEMRLGQGSHDENAEFLADGPGVPVWAMIWRPSEKKSVKADDDDQ